MWPWCTLGWAECLAVSLCSSCDGLCVQRCYMLTVMHLWIRRWLLHGWANSVVTRLSVAERKVSEACTLHYSSSYLLIFGHSPYCNREGPAPSCNFKIEGQRYALVPPASARWDDTSALVSHNFYWSKNGHKNFTLTSLLQIILPRVALATFGSSHSSTGMVSKLFVFLLQQGQRGARGGERQMEWLSN